MKKASLQMSISTIVTLILSMTLLGFGLMFIRSTFTNATNQFTAVNGQVKQQMQAQLREGSSRFAIQNAQPTVKKGKTVTTYIALKNVLGKKYTFYINGKGSIDQNGDWNVTKVSCTNTQKQNPAAEQSVIQCYADDNGDPLSVVKKAVKFKTLESRSLENGQSVVLSLAISASPTAASGTYYCEIIISDPSVTASGSGQKCTPQEYVSKEVDVTVSD